MEEFGRDKLAGSIDLLKCMIGQSYAHLEKMNIIVILRIVRIDMIRKSLIEKAKFQIKIAAAFVQTICFFCFFKIKVKCLLKKSKFRSYIN